MARVPGDWCRARAARDPTPRDRQRARRPTPRGTPSMRAAAPAGNAATRSAVRRAGTLSAVASCVAAGASRAPARTTEGASRTSVIVRISRVRRCAVKGAAALRNGYESKGRLAAHASAGISLFEWRSFRSRWPASWRSGTPRRPRPGRSWVRRSLTALAPPCARRTCASWATRSSSDWPGGPAGRRPHGRWHRSRPRAWLHRRPQPLDRWPGDRSRGRLADLAGHHDACSSGPMAVPRGRLPTTWQRVVPTPRP